MVDWCLACGEAGGQLAPCSRCPAALCSSCRGEQGVEGEAAVYCSTCASGSLARYSDLVWVKHGAYRWWPCQVVHPCHLPNNVSISISDFFSFPKCWALFYAAG